MANRIYPNGQTLWDGEKLYYSNGNIAWANGIAFYPNEATAYVNHCGFYKNGDFLWRGKIGYNEDGSIFSNKGRFAVYLTKLICLLYDEYSVSVVIDGNYSKVIVLQKFC